MPSKALMFEVYRRFPVPTSLLMITTRLNNRGRARPDAASSMRAATPITTNQKAAVLNPLIG